MIPAVLIDGCVMASILGVLIAVPLSAFGKGSTGHRRAQLLLAVSTGIGAMGALLFFFSNSATRSLFTLPFLFHATFVVDSLSSIFFFLISGITSVCAVFALAYVEEEKHLYHVPSLNAFTMLFVLGMQLVVLATTVIGFMASWEIMSVASFFLVLADRKCASVKAAFLYLGMAQLGAFAILGGFLLTSSGVTDPSLALAPAQDLAQWQVVVAFALFLFGFGSKAGLVPFHVWLPEAHPQAPSHISALLSAVMLKVAVYGFLRAVFMILPLSSMAPAFGIVVVIFGLLSAVSGAFFSALKTDIKRVLAYSSIENLGLIFVMIGFCMITQQLPDIQKLVMVALLLHIINHAFFKSGLFLSVGVIAMQTHTRNIESLGGLARRMPLFTFVFCILALAGSALPPLGTFFGEWLFLQSTLSSLVHATPIVAGLGVLILCFTVLISAIGAFSMIRLFAMSSLGLPRSKAAEHTHEPRRLLLVPITILGLMTVVMSIVTPSIAAIINPSSVAAAALSTSALTLPIASISPWIILILVLVVAFVVFVAQKYLTRSPALRHYQTWDCGQPIDATMEYTATGFAAPLRLFFGFLIRSQKHLVATPVLASNPWIKARTCAVVFHSRSASWYRHGKGMLLRISALVRRVQSGILQLYLLIIFLTLLTALLIAL